MYFSWRITKYNPKYRDEKGSYVKEDWTSMYDIGKFFSGKEVTHDEYLNIERLYVDAITEYMNCLGISTLTVKDLEKWSETIEILDFPELYTKEMSELYARIKEGVNFNIEEIRDLSRLILRNNIWCILEKDSIMYVHFGHDYYMFIGSFKECKDAVNKIIRSGLYVEPFISPFIEE